MERILTIEERLQYLEENNPNIEIEVFREEIYNFEDDEVQHLCLDDFDVPRTINEPKIVVANRILTEYPLPTKQ